MIEPQVDYLLGIEKVEQIHIEKPIEVSENDLVNQDDDNELKND